MAGVQISEAELTVTDADRAKYRRELWTMSDIELRSLYRSIAIEVTVEGRLNTPMSRAKAIEKTKKAKIAAEIPSEREKRKEKCREWRASLAERQHNAIKNLKYAASANGQLVLAILEEEGELTLEEINSWCDEMETFDSDTLSELLQHLVDEGMAGRNGDLFYYKFAIKDTMLLFPVETADHYIRLVQNRKKLTVKVRKTTEFIIDYLNRCLEDVKPVYIEDLSVEALSVGDETITDGYIQITLSMLCEENLLVKEDDYYCFPMLGEI